MKHIFSISLCFLALSLSAQETITYPYNPDGDADGLVAVPDIQDLLAVYGSPFSPAEIMVGDSTLESWVEMVNEAMAQEVGFGQKNYWLLDALEWIEFDFPSRSVAMVDPQSDGFLQVSKCEGGGVYIPFELVVLPEDLVPCGAVLEGCDGIEVADIFVGDAYNQYRFNDQFSAGSTPLTIPVREDERILIGNPGGDVCLLQKFIWTPLLSMVSESVQTYNNGPCQGEFTINYHGNDYELVEIGEQCWFAENLKAKALNDGTEILGAFSENNGWPSPNTNEMRWAYPGGNILPQVGGDAGEGFEYTLGLFYNGLVALEQVCPQGYHVPSKDDFDVLINLFGGDSEAGLFLKDKPPLGNGSNKSGFKGVMTGDLQNQNYYNYPNRAVFWTSSVYGENNYGGYYIWEKDLSIINNNVVEAYRNSSGHGASIRCIKD